ncbi:MAG: hypothetical protein AAF570_22755 [Bacteroidota bacterium]
MQLGVYIYTPELKAGALRKTLRAMSEHGTHCEVPPGTHLATHKGRIHFRMTVDDPLYRNVPRLTGFNWEAESYDYEAHYEALRAHWRKHAPPRNLFQMLFRIRPKVDFPFIAGPEMDDTLRLCTHRFHLNWDGEEDDCTFRLGLHFASAFAEMTGGLVEDPVIGRWLTGPTATHVFHHEVEHFEEHLEPADLMAAKFMGWPKE